MLVCRDHDSRTGKCEEQTVIDPGSIKESLKCAYSSVIVWLRKHPEILMTEIIQS